jgi:hypothetical protein
MLFALAVSIFVKNWYAKIETEKKGSSKANTEFAGTGEENETQAVVRQ